MASDLAALNPDAQVMVFPHLEILPYDIIAQGHEVAASRLTVLEALIAPPAPAAGDRRRGRLMIVTPVEALTRRLPPPADLARHRVELSVGKRYDLEELQSSLAMSGHERVEAVETPGQFAVRGGILDLFLLTREQPVRAEFLGDQLESLRRFDPLTQRSTGETDREQVFAASEFLPGPDRAASGMAAISAELARTAAGLDAAGKSLEAEKLRARVEGHLERIAAADMAGLEQYLPYFYGDACMLLDSAGRRAGGL
ncbi:MAG: hypothetical protein A2Y96_00105 [Firmicutes bacterium RBG_13_65_8]|nr:MAG: hypothetical protein A2Y96_00105 [Firmicutes bacterium RBG_13_65_8]